MVNFFEVQELVFLALSKCVGGYPLYSYQHVPKDADPIFFVYNLLPATDNADIIDATDYYRFILDVNVYDRIKTRDTKEVTDAFTNFIETSKVLNECYNDLILYLDIDSTTLKANVTDEYACRHNVLFDCTVSNIDFF